MGWTLLGEGMICIPSYSLRTAHHFVNLKLEACAGGQDFHAKHVYIPCWHILPCIRVMFPRRKGHVVGLSRLDDNSNTTNTLKWPSDESLGRARRVASVSPSMVLRIAVSSVDGTANWTGVAFIVEVTRCPDSTNGRRSTFVEPYVHTSPLTKDMRYNITSASTLFVRAYLGRTARLSQGVLRNRRNNSKQIGDPHQIVCPRGW